MLNKLKLVNDLLSFYPCDKQLMMIKSELELKIGLEYLRDELLNTNSLQRVLINEIDAAEMRLKIIVAMREEPDTLH